MNKSEQKPKTRVKVSNKKTKSPHSIGINVVTQLKVAKARRSKQVLNGSHGEYTGDDDMPKQKGKMVKKAKRVVKRAGKKIRKVAADGLQLSVCAAKYAIAIADPWDRNAMGACVPSFPSRPSMKTHGFIRGTVTIGGAANTTGFGWIAISPCLANDQASLYYTTTNNSVGAYDGSSLIRPYSGSNVLTVGVVGEKCSNLPFTGGQLRNNINGSAVVQGRIVSASCSVRYTGTELNRGGSVYCYSSPDHSNLVGYAVDGLGIFNETEISSPGSNRNKCSVTTFGVNDEELRYGYIHPQFEITTHDTLTATYPFSDMSVLQSAFTGASAVGGCPMVIGLNGVAGTTYYFEYLVHVEYIGQAAQSMLTPNTVDFDGLAVVQTAASNLFAAKMSNPMTPMPVLMKRELQDAIKTYGPAMRKAGGALLKSSFR